LYEAQTVSKSASVVQDAPRRDPSNASWRALGHPSRSALATAKRVRSQASRGSFVRLSKAFKQAFRRCVAAGNG
jgi:hypothetical protein